MDLLAEYLKAIDYQITGGSEFLWKCYGPNARFLERVDEKFHVGAIFDTQTKTVYEMEISHTNDGDVRYKWYNPDYFQVMKDEAESRQINWNKFCDDLNWHVTDSSEDILDKIVKILAGEEYDTRVVLALDLDSDTLETLNKAADLEGITVEEFVERVLTKIVEEEG